MVNSVNDTPTNVQFRNEQALSQQKGQPGVKAPQPATELLSATNPIKPANQDKSNPLGVNTKLNKIVSTGPDSQRKISILIADAIRDCYYNQESELDLQWAQLSELGEQGHQFAQVINELKQLKALFLNEADLKVIEFKALKKNIGFRDQVALSAQPAVPVMNEIMTTDTETETDSETGSDKYSTTESQQTITASPVNEGKPQPFETIDRVNKSVNNSLEFQTRKKMFIQDTIRRLVYQN